MHLFIQNKLRMVIVGALLLPLLLFNVIAYNQAHSMLNFLPGGTKTDPIESLSLNAKLGLLFTGITVPKPQNHVLPDAYDLPFEIHHVKSADYLLEAWHIPASDSKAEPKGESNGIVLLFHGYAESKSSLLNEAKAFYTMGYSLFLVDFRGSGGSEGAQTTVGFLEGDDVAASFRYVQTLADSQPIILYGHSMGAASIVRSLATHNITPDAIIIEAVFAEMVTTVQNRFRSMGLPSFPAAHVLIFWAGVQNGFSGFAHNPVAYAAAVEVPTLMMHGTDDPRATLDEGERVYAAIAAQDKRLVRFQKVGHESYLSAQPEKWMREVQAFLGNRPHANR